MKIFFFFASFNFQFSIFNILRFYSKSEDGTHTLIRVGLSVVAVEVEVTVGVEVQIERIASNTLFKVAPPATAANPMLPVVKLLTLRVGAPPQWRPRGISRQPF